MIENLPKLYVKALIEPLTADSLSVRKNGIEKIIKEKDIGWRFDCIRLHFSKQTKSKGFSDEFVDLFRKEDALFASAANDLELRILAGVIISECIKRDDKAPLLALAVQSASFGLDKEMESVVADTLKCAKDFLRNQSIKDRLITPIESFDDTLTTYDEEASPDDRDTAIKRLHTFVANLTVNYQRSVRKLQHSINVLDEESNIHWYLFREHSLLESVHVKELNAEAAPFLLALELFSLISIELPSPNSIVFLSKLLSGIPRLAEKELSIRNIVEGMWKHYRKHLDLSKVSKLGNLCPMHLAYNKVVESGGDEGWLKVFDLATGLNGNFQAKSVEFAYQCLCECFLMEFNDE